MGLMALFGHDTNMDTDILFEQGIDAFERGNYEAAISFR
jgi:hypothetical protein